MSFSFASVKAALTHLFGVEEDKAHHLVTAIEADVTPVLDQARQQLHDLLAEGHADLAALLNKGLADIRADLADIKAALAPAPLASPEPPKAGPTPAA